MQTKNEANPNVAIVYNASSKQTEMGSIKSINSKTNKGIKT